MCIDIYIDRYVYIYIYAGGMIGEKQEMNQQINDGHMMGI
jgi:glycerol-3-phosphate responsive antiterminator